MKITNVVAYLVPPRWLYLKIETDEGIAGWGEPIVEGRAATVATAVSEWRDYLIGKDPRDIERHWQVMYRCAFYRGGPVLMSAIAGIDQALWDIKAKALNVPIYELLGGAVRDEIQVYRSIHGDTPDELAADARRAVDEGYTLIKSSAIPAMRYLDSRELVDDIICRIDAVRQAIGSRIGLAVDFHGRVHLPMAKVLIRELNQFDLAFIEEPVLPQNNEALPSLAAVSHSPIATGERLFNRWDFKETLAGGAVGIIQPDLSHAGGISECRRLAAMAEAYDVAFAPHCPLGPIALSACLQVDTASINAVFQEQSIDIHLASPRNVLIETVDGENPFQFKCGRVPIPKMPGLGISMNTEKIEELSRYGHDWKNPIWQANDGTPIEW